MKSIYGRFFGEFLVDKKVITPNQLKEALELQRQTRKPIGLLGVDLGYLRAEQVVELLVAQRTADVPFGKLAVSRGYLTREQLHELLEQQAESHLFLGEALVRMGALTYQQLESLLDAFQPENNRLSSIMRSAFSGIPQGEVLRSIVEVVHRILYRAISGHVRVTRVESSCYGLRDIEGCVLIKRSEAHGPGFDYGLAMTRPVLLSLVYCLLQRATWSKRLINEVLTDLAGAMDYALVKSCFLHDHAIPSGSIEVHDGLYVPLSKSACVSMHSTIGELELVFTPGTTA